MLNLETLARTGRREAKTVVVPRAVSAVLCYLILCIAMSFPPAILQNADDNKSLPARKHRRLQSIKSPKIVLIGGSNVATGIDSAAIQQALGRPVANMGFGVTLGLKYQLEELKDDIGAGDLLVVMPEYENFNSAPKAECNARLNGCSDLFNIVILYPEALKWVLAVYSSYPAGAFDGFDDFFRFLRLRTKVKETMFTATTRLLDSNFHISMRRLFERSKGHGMYTFENLKTGTGFNIYGDFVGHLGLSAPGIGSAEPMNFPYIYCEEASTALSSFAALAEKKNAHVLILPPPAPVGIGNMWKLDAIYEHWKKLKPVSVIAVPQRYTFQRQLFFDTVYHLGDAGRKQRTAMIIEDLLKYIQNTELKSNKSPVSVTQSRPLN